MKTTETLKALAATRLNAIDTATILYTVAKQQTHPTTQLERRQAADRHRHFADGVQIAIYEINELHTDDAAEMVGHLKSIAAKLERKGWNDRMEDRLETAARQFGKATGLRYAAQMLADENCIDVDFDIIHYNDPLQEGGEA